MANTKTGGGGQPEAYDENTGRYVAQDGGSGPIKTYHSGAGMSKNNIIDNLKNGKYGNDFKDAFEQASPEEQEEMIAYIQEFFDTQNTEVEKEKRYVPLTQQEYNDFKSNFFNSNATTPFEREMVNRYIGTGATSFYLNTAMRMGYDEMLKQFIANEGYNPNDRPGDWLSRPEVEKFIQAMDSVTHKASAPRDMQVIRYTGTGPLVSWLKDTDILNGMQIESNGWHNKLVKGTYTLPELADRLKKGLVGAVMPVDGSILSFSMVPKQSHMIKHTGAKQKDIMFKIDVDEGQPMYITSNSYESEGFFPRDIEFFVKDVGVETDSNGMERVVVYYGIRKK